MKSGKSIVELAQEIERQYNARKDFIASTENFSMQPKDEEKGVELWLGRMNGKGEEPPIVVPNDLAHQQIGAHVGIHKTYYDKMLAQAPALLGRNVNHWFSETPSTRMVRTIDGRARAFVSESYRPLENFDLMAAVLPTLQDNNLVIMSCEVTERNLYIKAVDPRIQRDVPTGKKIGDGSHTFFDTVSPAIVLRNSEVGLGPLVVESGIFTKVCTNLATISGAGMRRRHVGPRHGEIQGVEDLQRLLSDETRKASDRALWLTVRDVVKGAFDEAVFDSRVAKLVDMTKDKIEADPVKVVEAVKRKFSLTEQVAAMVGGNLNRDGDMTRYGVFNAITRTAQDVRDYDEASELERIGGHMIDLAPSEWRQMAMAA